MANLFSAAIPFWNKHTFFAVCVKGQIDPIGKQRVGIDSCDRQMLDWWKPYSPFCWPYLESQSIIEQVVEMMGFESIYSN